MDNTKKKSEIKDTMGKGSKSLCDYCRQKVKVTKVHVTTCGKN